MPRLNRNGFGRISGQLFWFVFVLATGLCTQALAIDIHVTYTHDETQENDPSGAWLLSLATAAAEVWEDYLPDAGTYNIDFCYETLDDNVLGTANSITSDISIDVRPASDWFVDDSPKFNSEFDFVTQDRAFDASEMAYDYRGGQWLFGDLDPAEQTGWFNGNPPNLMEVGYLGRAFSGNDGPNGWAKPNEGFDMFTVILHEIGHVLGVNSDPLGGDWHADPTWVAGRSVEFPYNSGHMIARTSLLTDAGQFRGVRVMPSAIDIMAVAADESFTNIDLPRQDFVGNGNWSESGKWMGGALPDNQDRAFLRDLNDVVVDQAVQVRDLFLGGLTNLDVANDLAVFQQATLIENSTMDVRAGAVAAMFDVDLRGTLNVFGKVESPKIAISSLGVIQGQGGTVEFGGPGVRLINNSRIVGAIQA